MAEIQKVGGTAAYVDAEHCFDPGYARKLGVGVGNLLLSRPDGGEWAVEITDTLVRSGAVDIVVVDFDTARVPRAELEGEMGDSRVGLHARLMSWALRKLTGSNARAAGELRAVVGEQAFRGAPLLDEAVQHLDRVLALEPPPHFDRRAFAAEHIDHRQGTELRAVARPVVDEVQAPRLVRALRDAPRSRCTTILRRPGRLLRRAKPSSRYRRQTRFRR